MNRVAKTRKASVLFLTVLLAGLAAPFFQAGSAMAHPLGNFTINRYARVELYRGEAVVHYVLDFAEIPALQLILDADSDGDGALSEAEQSAFLPAYADGLLENVTLDGPDGAASLAVAGSTVEITDGQGGLDVIRVALVLTAPVDATAGEFTFTDENFAGRAGWKEVVIAPSNATATVAGGFLDDTSDALRTYPEDALAAAPDESRATFTWDPTTGSAAPAAFAVEQGGAAAVRGDRFSGLLEADRSLGIILLSLLAAFGFGALHALGPGHGKSVVAAYLVGSKGTPRHALALGLTVTATHTAAVYGLGFVTLVASDLIAPERLFVYLGVVSGLMIVLMGVALLIGRLRSLRTKRASDGLHRHGIFGREHSHLPGHAHVHASSEHGHAHPHAHAATTQPSKVTWRGLLTLGIAGGLIPCPSALVVMLAAISLGQVLFGMLLIVAFSFGLAGVLVAIGLALVLGRRLSSRSGAMQTLRRPVFARALAAVPVLSAIGVTLAGVAITYQAWNQPGL